MPMFTACCPDQHLDEYGLRSVGAAGPLRTPAWGRWRPAAPSGELEAATRIERRIASEIALSIDFEPHLRAKQLAARAQQRLQASPYPGLRSVRCDARPHLIVFRGRVRSLHLKQLAQEIVRDLCGTRTIMNLLEVIQLDRPSALRDSRRVDEDNRSP